MGGHLIPVVRTLPEPVERVVHAPDRRSRAMTVLVQVAFGRQCLRSRMTEGGTYTLVFSLPTATTIEVGALGAQRFPAGGYCYSGSALGSGGFSRIDRHRRVAAGEHDVRHWHVDYFGGHPAVELVAVERTPGRDCECTVAQSLGPAPCPASARLTATARPISRGSGTSTPRGNGPATPTVADSGKAGDEPVALSRSTERLVACSNRCRIWSGSTAGPRR
ncbi:DUF123 domain-containing protein [Halolamina pelagica]|uniref:GIY-YIG nuclease family protein n=1 Tax=Halolamina pelagica TaxID=699431 RepID=UPI00373FDCCB